MRLLGLLFSVLMLAVSVYAVTNQTFLPTSNVLADSSASANTVMGHASDGSFGIVAVTSTTMMTTVAPSGQIYLIFDTQATARYWATCISTGGATAANLVFLSTNSTNAGGFVNGNAVIACRQTL